MTLIDRMIIRQFVVTALFSLLAVTVIFVVVDAMEKLDSFIDRQATPAVVMQYYVSFIPEIWQGHVNGGEGFWTALERLEQWF